MRSQSYLSYGHCWPRPQMFTRPELCWRNASESSRCNGALTACERTAKSISSATKVLHAWVVPGARIELATPAFSGRRSTNELPRRHGNFNILESDCDRVKPVPRQAQKNRRCP